MFENQKNPNTDYCQSMLLQSHAEARNFNHWIGYSCNLVCLGVLIIMSIVISIPEANQYV